MIIKQTEVEFYLKHISRNDNSSPVWLLCKKWIPFIRESQLDRAERELITLVYYEGNTIEEYAKRNNISRATAYRIRSTAIAKIVGYLNSDIAYSLENV